MFVQVKKNLGLACITISICQTRTLPRYFEQYYMAFYLPTSTALMGHKDQLINIDDSSHTSDSAANPSRHRVPQRTAKSPNQVCHNLGDMSFTN